MGFDNRGGGGKTFVNQFKGDFLIKCDKDHPEAVERTNKNGKVVYERHYDYFEGFLTNIQKTEHKDFGLRWEVTMEDEGNTYVFQFPYRSMVAMGLIYRMPFMDFTKRTGFQLHHFEEKDKTAMTVFQDGVKLEAWWRKEQDDDNWTEVERSQRALPELQKVVVNNEEVWDATERMAFLDKIVFEKFLPKIKAAIIEQDDTSSIIFKSEGSGSITISSEGTPDPVQETTLSPEAEKAKEKATQQVEELDDLPF